MEIIELDKEFITLGQLLKYENIVESGGMVKMFLSENSVFVNDIPENRRGKKLFAGDIIYIENIGKFEIKSIV